MASTPKSSATFQRLDFLPGLLASWVTILVFTYKIFKNRSTKKIKHVLKSVEVTESISFSTKFYIFEIVIVFFEKSLKSDPGKNSSSWNVAELPGVDRLSS